MYKYKLPALILETLRQNGAASPSQVAEWLDLPQESYPRVRDALTRMEKRRRVKRTRYGRYEALPDRVQPHHTFDPICDKSVQIIQELGGVATTGQIYRRLFHPQGRLNTTTRQYKNVILILQTHPKIEPVGFGRWGLRGGR